jgi:two-component system, response regulator PdtaR
VCGEAGDGEDAVQKAFALNPDVVLLNVAMPNLNGIDAAEIIKKYLPSATAVARAISSESWAHRPQREFATLVPPKKQTKLVTEEEKNRAGWYCLRLR